MRTTVEAAEHVNGLVARQIEGLGHEPELTVLDMGCGVGGTLFRLARAFPAGRMHGITISPTQSRLARRLAEEEGVADRCTVEVGDFQSARLDVAADVIVAIESFVHAQTADRFLAWAVDHLADGGHLVLVDDFLLADPDSLDARSRRLVEDFRRGWRIPALCTVEALVEAARRHGLEHKADRDLTPLIRLGRPRDRVIAAVSPMLRRLGFSRFPFFGNMIGGNALQSGLRRGLIGYRMIVFTRASEPR